MFPFLWKGADGVVAFEPCCEMHSWNMVCERPPRLRRIRRLRDIFLYGAATAPHEASRGGDYRSLEHLRGPITAAGKTLWHYPSGVRGVSSCFPLMPCKFGVE